MGFGFIGLILGPFSLLKTDFTMIIAPPKTSDFLQRRFHGSSTRRGRVLLFKNKIFIYAKDYRLMTSGWQGRPSFRKYGWGLVLKPTISMKKRWGDYRRTTLKIIRFSGEALQRSSKKKYGEPFPGAMQ